MEPEQTRLELLSDRAADTPFLLVGGAVIGVGEFRESVSRAARLIGEQRTVINLCDTREAFLAGYVAALQTRRTTLLPQSRAADVVESLHQMYPGSGVLSDADLLGGEHEATTGENGDLAGVPARHVVMIGFTSGSTGQPSRHAKLWGSVIESTRCNVAAIRAALRRSDTGRMPWIVGTVPSQHMYGMELTVLMPLISRMGLNAARPLLPMEVAEVLAQTPQPRVLVSTPAHLRAIVSSGIALPEVEVTISATAPLDAELARQVEAATGGVLLEMFGATETCIIGQRRTAIDADWSAYPGVSFEPDADGTRVTAPWFATPQRLQDVIEVLPGGKFRLVGRSADLVDVAGKRASLADLTRRLLQVPGVVDAVVFQPREARGLVRRVAALVVSPGRSAADVRNDFARQVDPVFLPRPLLVVETLPRTPAAKLPQTVLEAALSAAQVEN